MGTWVLDRGRPGERQREAERVDTTTDDHIWHLRDAAGRVVESFDPDVTTVEPA